MRSAQPINLSYIIHGITDIIVTVRNYLHGIRIIIVRIGRGDQRGITII
jgi:hypothetical protein